MRAPVFVAVMVLVTSVVATSGCGGGSSTGNDAAVPAGDAALEASPEASPDAPAAIVDISGWFRVTSDLEGACGATTASPLAPDYLWVERRVSTFIVRVCSAPMDESSCTGTLFYDFTQPTAGGSKADGGSAFFSAGCTLSYERAEATLMEPELHVQSLRDSITNDASESACTLAAAMMLTAPCTYEIDLVATRL